MQIEQPPMSLADIRFPRELEAGNTAETIRQALLAHTVKLRPKSDFVVPVIEISGPLAMALKRAKRQRQIRCGFENIADKLESERRGIDSVREKTAAPYGTRVSRLLFFSNDGAERFYRHVEQVISAHYPRLLGCLLNMDSAALGALIAGTESRVKSIMLEHKDSVCDILRAITPGR